MAQEHKTYVERVKKQILYNIHICNFTGHNLVKKCMLLSTGTVGHSGRDCLHCSWYLGTYEIPMSGMCMVERPRAELADNLHPLDLHFRIVGGIVSQTKTNLDLPLPVSCIGRMPGGWTHADLAYTA